MKQAVKALAATAAISICVAIPAAATVVNVGGGTWNYGTSYQFPAGKGVWSHYVHNGKYHSATAIIGSQQRKIYANAGSWANADLNGAAWEGTAAYWSTY